MSLDRSLKTSGGLLKHRNVLSRAERIAKLTEQGKFDPEQDSPLHLPKVASRKAAVSKATKKKGPEAEGEGETPAAGDAAAT